MKDGDMERNRIPSASFMILWRAARFVVRDFCLGASLSRKRSNMRPPISRLSSSTPQYYEEMGRARSVHGREVRAAFS
jgi:hypothetical protein